ncbi:MAG: DnaD domain protein [Christensenellales bacterium]
MFELDNQNRVFGVTTLENLFITEYLPSAEGDYIKVYLSALFHIQQHDEGFGVPQMAQELGLPESKVEAALRYWERRRLVSRISDAPLTYRFFHLGQHMLTGQDSQGNDRAYIDFSEAVYALFGARRKVRPAEIASAYEWVTELGLPQEVVLMLLTYCMDVRGASFTFKAAEKIAIAMKEDQVHTSEEAEAYLGHSRQAHEGTRAVLRRFSLRRLPTQDELDLYRKWTGAWGFSKEDVLDACAETVKAANPSFGYLNGILEGLLRRSAGKSAPVARQLDQDAQRMAGAREVLTALGTRISPSAILQAYESLLKLAPHEMIVLAAADVGQRKGKFEDIEKRLQLWQQQGLQDAEAVRAASLALRREDALLMRLYEAAGEATSPVDPDRELLLGWLAQGLPAEVILFAAGQARSAKVKMPYIGAIMKSYLAQGIRTLQQAQQAKLPDSAAAAKTVGGQRYGQREYTEEELNRGLQSDLDKARKYDEQ